MKSRSSEPSWRLPCRLLGLVVVVGGFLLPHAQAQTWESCFDEANPPSCSDEKEGILVDDSFDAQPACALLDMEFLWGIQFHTAYHAKALSVIPADTELCDQVRRAYHLCYWCTPNIKSHDYCFFTSCEEPEEIDETVDINGTCTELDALFVKDEFPATMDLCYRAQQAKHICSSFCQHKPDYLGADSTKRKKSLAWASRVAAILSFCAASYILWDVLSKRKNRIACYHQILVGMACFDIATAVAWSLSTLPIPDDEGFYIEGASGNASTCTATRFLCAAWTHFRVLQRLAGFVLCLGHCLQLAGLCAKEDSNTASWASVARGIWFGVRRHSIVRME